MSEKSLIDAIKHYQKDIERSPGNAERMLRCLKRLYVMPIKVEHLQQTGVGRSVNNLREASGEVGDAATALVAKWKAMVTAEDMVKEEDSPEEEDEEIKSQSNSRVSPDDRSVKDKENIRLNHRNDNVKNDSSKKTEKSDKSQKRSDKDVKDKSSKHSSKERESSSRKESSSKNHVGSKDKDKKDKERRSDKLKESSKSDSKNSSEKRKESSKSEHKSSSEKDRKHRDDKDKSNSKDRDKHSSRHKDVGKEKERKHSSSSSKDKHKDKVSSSRDKDRSNKDKSRDRSRDRKDKNSSKDCRRTRSHDREKESRKSEKRKHRDKERDNEKSSKRFKRERSSSAEEDDSDEGSHENSSRVSDSDEENNHSSDEGSNHSDEERSQSGSDKDSESENYSKVRIKQEPLSDCESDEDKSKKKSSHKESNNRSSSSSSSKHKSSEEMKPPKTDDLKALIKENEKKIKKEKVDVKYDKVKKQKSKIELNQDGSIDSGSGASFADALMGFDKPSSGSPKKKKKKEEKPSSSQLSTSSLIASSMSTLSRSPSQCSSSSFRSTASPIKQERKSTIADMKEAPAALLKKPVKLEPLSLDISSTLPEISTNYKPLPSIQSRHTPRDDSPQVMSEEQMFNIMTSKNQRTKVYSGYKYGQVLSVPSLYTFCIQVLYDNIDCLEYTGGVPYEILKPLLNKLNADQLSNLEHFNPYLVTDTDDLWKFHCKKTFPKGQRDDMESWREVYLRCMDEREIKLKKLTAYIAENMATMGPSRQAKLAYVDSVAKPPRSIARKQVKYGTGTGSSSPVAGTSSSSISQIAAAQNQSKKKEIVSKAIVGGFTPATQATEQVPGFSNPSAAAKILKKKKAPLMAKALQLIKGNRFKR